jgi:hypothetical protein
MEKKYKWSYISDGISCGHPVKVSCTVDEIELVPLWDAELGVTVVMAGYLLTLKDLATVVETAKEILALDPPTRP